MIGVRVKLASRGAGRWRSSAGYRSKFGLTITEVLEALDYLKARDMADCLQLTHFHLGSQITNIRKVKEALTEAARVFVELHRAGAGLQLHGRRRRPGHRLRRLADRFRVVASITRCRNTPTTSSSASRASATRPACRIRRSSPNRAGPWSPIIACWSSTCSAPRTSTAARRPDEIPADAPQPIADLFAIHRDLNKKNFLESYHDSVQAMEETLNLFNLGYLTIEMRALAERLFWAVGRKLQRLVRELDYVPEELQNLDTMLSDTYFCNFSVFQSMPDSWAIKQLFPIMPIHRLGEAPSRRAVLGDITCDSDGKVDQFIDLRDVRNTLELHPFNGEPYYLGAFLLGAYQEILGDLHNLFGDTNAVHVNLEEDGSYTVDEFIPGDTVREVLHYVQFSAEKLIDRMRKDVEKALSARARFR